MVPNTDYNILGAPTMEELRVLVKAAIANGWVVAGGVAVGDSSVQKYRNLRYYQAVVKAPNTLQTLASSVDGIASTVSTIDSKLKDQNE